MTNHTGFGREADESDQLIEHGIARQPVAMGMGALIGIGAGLGMSLGVILGDLVLGMIAGAAVGTVAGAIFESLRARRRD